VNAGAPASSTATLPDDVDRSQFDVWTAAVVTPLDSSEIDDAKPQWRRSKRRVPFHCSRPGSWVAARVERGFGPITAVALYGLMDELSDASVHRSLSELSPVIDDPKYNRQVILGGDLNTGTQWPEGDAFNKRDRNVLDRIEALGLVDCIRLKRPAGRLPGCPCVEGQDCSHVRTRRDPRGPSIPYQTDYLFASPRLAAGLVSCAPLATDGWFAISDHAPILAEFELQPPDMGLRPASITAGLSTNPLLKTDSPRGASGRSEGLPDRRAREVAFQDCRCGCLDRVRAAGDTCYWRTVR
jgi:hypothetical protein